MNWTNTEKKIQLMELCQKFFIKQDLRFPDDVWDSFTGYDEDLQDFVIAIGDIIGLRENDE